MSLDEYVDNLIADRIADTVDDKYKQLQTVIHPDIHFKYNSINLLVARRGKGKTYRVMKEIIKLSQLENFGGYTTFLYVSDKTNDSTVNEMIKLVKLKVRIVKYDDLQPVLEDLIDAKAAYQDVLEKDLYDEVSDKTKKDLFTTLDLTNWVEETPHTIVLLDDAINVLKETKYRKIQNLLFQNRQPRLTIFICVQDIFGVPIKIRRNCDSVWIFSGLTDKYAFSMMLKQQGVTGINWEDYNQLQNREVLLISYDNDGTNIQVI
jgi:hypothetical protein